MEIWLRTLCAVGALYGAAGVALAAAGAHLTATPTVTTAAYFLLFHAPAILAVCAIGRDRPTPALLAAASTLALGTFLFSGDLALRGLGHIVLVRMAAPSGGVLLIFGWLIAAAVLPLSVRFRTASSP